MKVTEQTQIEPPRHRAHVLHAVRHGHRPHRGATALTMAARRARTCRTRGRATREFPWYFCPSRCQFPLRHMEGIPSTFGLDPVMGPRWEHQSGPSPVVFSGSKRGRLQAWRNHAGPGPGPAPKVFGQREAALGRDLR